MLHLLKIEWLKVKNYRAFWVFSILYLASIFLVNYIAWSVVERTQSQAPAASMVLGSPFAFPKVWQTVGWFSSWLLYFPGMIIIMLMVNEFNFKTHRQNVIDGWSRKQFIGVKIAIVVLFSVLITVLNAITSIFFGSLSGGGFSFEGMEYLIYIFFQSLAYLFLALMLAVLFRRSGLAIIIFFLYGLIFEWLICGLLTFQAKATPFSYFLPLQTTDVLIPIPFGEKVFYPDAPSAIALIIGVLAYITLYVFFARKKFLVDDL
ncbi:ABC transporter permease [Terrimonas sp. NA20]|uniref:ABC transporter permease n=1 Tax=Terrimonas ginsenosidimutans TaxID=2908004 RepID=A0ABS9KW84_9BACT|nr:ABC transporter permease [Terrimonas ginsenosidimutans]MCG2616494.1 ABC transporter permease [Terrimonas ginsenosidimutans]